MATITVQTGSGTRIVPDTIEGIEVSEGYIPVIDLANIKSTDPAIRQNLAQELRKACTEVGFFYIRNHGIPESLIARQFDDAKRFFDLPLDVKLKSKVTKEKTGYIPLMGEKVDPASRGDLHENFDFGARGYGTFEEEDAKINQWPDEEALPGFKQNCVEYWHALRELALGLFPLFALALGVDEHYFDDKLRHPSAMPRMLFYPPQEGVIDPRSLGIGAHHDYELVTILAQGDVPALQILDSQNRWIAAPVIPGTFVCNIGDQMQRWTNEVFKSTLHRAINRSGRARYSLPFFFAADADAPLDPIPTCITPSNPQKYESILAGEYIAQRLKETYVVAYDE